MTFETVKQNPRIRYLIEEADRSLLALGFTEHSFAHVGLVARRAGKIMEVLGKDPRQAELARIAGYLHDIGNLVNRVEHSQSGAIMAFQLLTDMGFPVEETAPIVTAIGNHDEGTGTPVNDIAAAVILADKSDVRRSRVRNTKREAFDIHDRVNYSVTDSSLTIDPEKTRIELRLTVDPAFSSVMEYFDIFLERMRLCREAANRLGLRFKFFINDQALL